MADQEVPEEIQDYYQTERRERAGVAWLLAFGTLIVTVLLAGGIFFGGRAAYRRFIDDEQGQTPEVAQNDQPEEERAAESANDQQTQQSQPEASNTGGQGSAVQGEESSDNTNPTPNPTPTPTPTPTTGDTGDIPNTGPGSTISIFFAVSILGYAAHRLYVKSNWN